MIRITERVRIETTKAHIHEYVPQCSLHSLHSLTCILSCHMDNCRRSAMFYHNCSKLLSLDWGRHLLFLMGHHHTLSDHVRVELTCTFISYTFWSWTSLAFKERLVVFIARTVSLVSWNSWSCIHALGIGDTIIDAHIVEIIHEFHIECRLLIVGCNDLKEHALGDLAIEIKTIIELVTSNKLNLYP
jgi:hypothetical protein